MSMSRAVNPDAVPQPMGEFKPLDEWQAHISDIFYGLRGGRVQDYYQTFASADYRLAHALAADYFSRVCAREKVRSSKFEVRTCHAPRPCSPSPITSSPALI